MASTRQYELATLTLSPRHRPPLRKDYSPPEVPVHLPPPPPHSPNPASHSSTETRSSKRSHESDIVDAQIHYAIHGPPSSISPSPSYPSSLASSPLNLPLRSNPGSTTTNTNTNTTTTTTTTTTTASRLALASLPIISAAEKEALFRACLSASSVDVDELRRLVWAHGMPDTTWARPMAWKLLVEYLPPDRVYWERVLALRRAKYWAMVADVTVDPTGKPLKDGDHPLSTGQDSEWREFFEDVQLRKEIRKDVIRTYPELGRMEALRDSLERVLFVYAKTHPQLRYRQGMNELAVPFLIVFTEERGVDLSDVEADAYFCFDIVMGEMGKCYAPVETETEGMERQLQEFLALFRIKDPELERHFDELKIEMRFFALRWLRLWLAREFELPDLFALWDSFLTSEQRLGWVRYVCVAMLIRIREGLLAADFVDCMKLLLHYPPCDVTEILRTADRLRTSNVVIVRKAKP